MNLISRLYFALGSVRNQGNRKLRIGFGGSARLITSFHSNNTPSLLLVSLNKSKINDFCGRRYMNTATPYSRKGQGETKSLYDFDEEMKKIQAEVEKAVEPLVSLNNNFKIYRGTKHELVIETERGKHTIYEDREKQLLILQSYFSGYHNYAFNIENKVWLSIKDNHDFRGLLTRDLMRHCIGCPDFK